MSRFRVPHAKLRFYYEPPDEYADDIESLFLAGGITGCPDWQQYACRQLEGSSIVLLNPRRKNFPMNDPSAALAQIKWEHKHLRKATAISFWFPAEAIQPIALYELGAWSMTDKPMVVGAHPDYPRLQDVVVQTKLARPEVPVVASLDALVEEIQGLWNKAGGRLAKR